jgi:hypothetical protein
MNAAEYQSNRLAGSNIRITRITSGQTDLLARTFQSQPHEKKVHLAARCAIISLIPVNLTHTL